MVGGDLMRDEDLVPLLRGQPLASDLALEGAGDALVAGAPPPRRRPRPPSPGSRGGDELGDARPHRPATDDPDLLDLHCAHVRHQVTSRPARATSVTPGEPTRRWGCDQRWRPHGPARPGWSPPGTGDMTSTLARTGHRPPPRGTGRRGGRAADGGSRAGRARRAAVTGDHHLGVERFEPGQGRRPLEGVRVVEGRRRADLHQVAGEHRGGVRDVDDQIVVGVPVAEQEQLHVPVPQIDAVASPRPGGRAPGWGSPAGARAAPRAARSATAPSRRPRAGSGSPGTRGWRTAGPPGTPWRPGCDRGRPARPPRRTARRSRPGRCAGRRQNASTSTARCARAPRRRRSAPRR
jgi:hypothetical protein